MKWVSFYTKPIGKEESLFTLLTLYMNNSKISRKDSIEFFSAVLID